MIWTSVAVIAISAALVYYVERPEALNAGAVFQIAETVVTIAVVLLAVFVNYAWRWPVFAGWLVCIPVLKPSWSGSIVPIGPDDDRAATEPIAATLSIRQTLLHTSCTVRTPEMTSRSFAASIFVDDESGERRLAYSYSADPDLRNRERNPRHDGTALLSIELKPLPTLKGTYWGKPNIRVTSRHLSRRSTRSA